MFDCVLIANRGEIACRIIRTLRRLEIRSIAVYSDADSHARHIALADHAFRIGPPAPSDSYLRGDAILEAARRAQADAIHPGYGFLAENARFARTCAESGITFVGPTPEAIEAMGVKDRAKALMADAGIPLVPGYDGADQSDDALLEAAIGLGFPVLLKPVAGGGGKGMRVVADPADFSAALEGARREAASAFGDDRVLLERYLVRPRHIEAQIFGDRHGHTVHLFERDCSLQRRHQKVVEEAPAPGLTSAQRQTIGRAAVRAAQAIGYVNAGTIEFLMDQAGNFFFIEMNTRLQVEHPVTEMITGQDLVEWQLRVACGEPLPLTQEQISLCGHAIEARLYAEDPGKGFLPSTGRLDHLRFPQTTGSVRVDTGVDQGDHVAAFYDPMLAKIVVHGPDREGALRRLRRVLLETEIVGPETNLRFLARIAQEPEFAAGSVDTGFVELAEERLLASFPASDEWQLAMASLWLLCQQRGQAAMTTEGSADPHSPWLRSDGWRLNDAAHRTLRLGLSGRMVEVEARGGAGDYLLRIGASEIAANAEIQPNGQLVARLHGEIFRMRVIALGNQVHLFSPMGPFRIDLLDPLALAEAEDEAQNVLTAPMPGKIIRQPVVDGDHVKRGAALLVLEAMKMEHTITAPSDGQIAHLRYHEGDQVEEGAILVDFEPLVSE